MSDQNNEDQTALEELRYEAGMRDQIISHLEARALKAEQQCRDLCQSAGDVRARLADAENTLARVRAEVQAIMGVSDDLRDRATCESIWLDLCAALDGTS